MKRCLGIIVFLLSFSLLFSCKKWLDEKTDLQTAIPESFKDFQALLDNASVINAESPYFGEWSSDGHYMTDAYFQSRSENQRNAYLWAELTPYTADVNWNSSYKKVFYSNLILEELEKNKNSIENDPLQYNNIRGQSLFNRARVYFELSQLYAQVYNSATASSDFGIPLRMESDLNIATKRATVEETYNIIVSDLLKAKDLLPITPLYKTRASKPAAFALLARIYLAKEDYVKAKSYADSCLATNSALLNYNQIVSTEAFPLKLFNNEVIFHNTMGNFFSSASFIIDDEIYDLYSTNDLRKKAFFKLNTNGTKNFKGSYNGSIIPFSGLATDEIYLIRAECFARAGNTTEAMKDLNNLLRTRWITNSFSDYTATSSEDALRQILIERKKELLMRGIRWSDLRRLNKDPRFAFTINRTVNGIKYTLEPNSYKYTFPIATEIIQQTGIQQNPGWQK